MKKIIYLAAIAATFSFTSCSDDNDGPVLPPTTNVDGLFVVCNGNYMSGNGSLFYYIPSNNLVENNVFERANGMKLGDTAQSMVIEGNTGWICINGSNVIYAIDVDSYMVKGIVNNITSPRNALSVSANKLYVTSMYDNRISIVNPSTYSVTGHIEIPGIDASTGSTEQIVKIGDYVYVNCWSYQKQIVKIDSRTDKVVAQLEVGIQPQSITYDGKSLWVLCDGGGWADNPVGFERPSLHCVDLSTFTVERTILLTEYSSVSNLSYYNGHLYWIENGLQRMSVNATEAPAEPFVPSTSYGLYALDINPLNGDIYIADALDYMQAGIVTRYNSSGEELDRFNVGVIPSDFCWNLSLVPTKKSE